MGASINRRLVSPAVACGSPTVAKNMLTAGCQACSNAHGGLPGLIHRSWRAAKPASVRYAAGLVSPAVACGSPAVAKCIPAAGCQACSNAHGGLPSPPLSCTAGLVSPTVAICMPAAGCQACSNAHGGLPSPPVSCTAGLGSPAVACGSPAVAKWMLLAGCQARHLILNRDIHIFVIHFSGIIDRNYARKIGKVEPGTGPGIIFRRARELPVLLTWIPVDIV